MSSKAIYFKGGADMARSEAQKAADRRYAAAHKGEFITWTTKLKPAEAAVIKANNMSRADFLRWAADKIKE